MGAPSLEAATTYLNHYQIIDWDDRIDFYIKVIRIWDEKCPSYEHIIRLAAIHEFGVDILRKYGYLLQTQNYEYSPYESRMISHVLSAIHSWSEHPSFHKEPESERLLEQYLHNLMGNLECFPSPKLREAKFDPIKFCYRRKK